MKALAVQLGQYLGDHVGQHYRGHQYLDGCQLLVLRAIVQPMLLVFRRDLDLVAKLPSNLVVML